MEYLLGLLAVALGGWFFASRKANNAEALNENIETNNKILKFDEFIARNQAALETEKAKRDQEDADLKAKESKDVSKDELLDFLNNPNKPDDNK